MAANTEQRINTAVDKAEDASRILHSVAHGPVGTSVATENGNVLTVSTAINTITNASGLATNTLSNVNTSDILNKFTSAGIPAVKIGSGIRGTQIDTGTIAFSNLASALIATDVDAQNGTSDNLLMTPHRVRQAFDAFMPPSGKVVQVAYNLKSDVLSYTSGAAATFVDIDPKLSVQFTPLSVNNLVFLIASLNLSGGVDNLVVHLRFVRDGTAIGIGDTVANRVSSTASVGTVQARLINSTLIYMDTVSNTLEKSYKIQWALQSAFSLVTLNRTYLDATNSGRTVSTFTAMEIAP